MVMTTGGGGGVSTNDMKSMNPLQQQNMYYRQSPPQQQQQQQSLHQQQQNQQLHPSNNMSMDPSLSSPSASSFGQNPNGPNNPNQQHQQQGQTINFTQQHLRMASNVSPGVNNPSISPVSGNTMNRSMMGVVPNNIQGGPNSALTLNPMGVRMSMPNRMSSGQGL